MGNRLELWLKTRLLEKYFHFPKRKKKKRKERKIRKKRKKKIFLGEHKLSGGRSEAYRHHTNNRKGEALLTAGGGGGRNGDPRGKCELQQHRGEWTGQGLTLASEWRSSQVWGRWGCCWEPSVRASRRVLHNFKWRTPNLAWPFWKI